jgi:hypothetical protein
MFVTLEVSKLSGSVSEVRAYILENIRLIFVTLEVSKLSGRVREVRACML